MKEYKSFYKRAGGGEGDRCNYSTRLDTYGCGCQHDCNYCYARSLLDFRGLWSPHNPSIADIEKIRRKIKTLPKEVVRLGGMTDCFQPLEKTEKITYETIKALNENRVPYLIVTKSDLVAEYMDVLDKELAHIQISVTTTDDELSKTYEKAVVPSKRIMAAERLNKAGFDTTLRLSPFIREYMDYEILNSIDVDKALVEFLRVNHWIKQWFDIDFSPYFLKSGGYEHLPLNTKIEWIKPLRFKEITVCEDVPEHYEYWKNHFNPNKEDCCNLR